MVTLIPEQISASTNIGEKMLFEALQNVSNRDDWICLHGLHQYKVVQGVETEGDFIVLIPEKGIVVIESKGATSALIDGDKWTLDGVAEKSRHRSPVEQVENVRNNVKALINTNDIDATTLPIARIVWFPKLDPSEFEQVGKKGMEFYPWEIKFFRDIENIDLEIMDAIESEIRIGPEKGRDYIPGNFDLVEMKRIRDILRVKAKAILSKDGISEIRRVQLSGATNFLLPVWEILQQNNNFYIEGTAGTGKSALLKHAANEYASQGRKVLVTCNGVLMAEELLLYFEHQPNVDVYDIGNLFLETPIKQVTIGTRESYPLKLRTPFRITPIWVNTTSFV